MANDMEGWACSSGRIWVALGLNTEGPGRVGAPLHDPFRVGRIPPRALCPGASDLCFAAHPSGHRWGSLTM
eukprot:10744265-Alexandrium_andersonii.AAC.1